MIILSSFGGVQVKMEPLSTNQRVLRWLCICPATKNTSESIKWARVLFSWTIFTLNLFAFVLPVLFFVKFISTDLESCLYALFQIPTTGNIVYMTIIAFFLRHKITAVFENLSIIYAASKNQNINSIGQTFQSLLILIHFAI